jgi:hypothetical protein
MSVFVNFVCCPVEVCATSRSLVQRSPTEFDVSECDREASIMGRPRFVRAVKPRKIYILSRYESRQ